MANRVSIFRVTSITILDSTILDADINAAASITRTKMNEDQDIRARNGATIYIYNAANAKHGKLYHDANLFYIFSDDKTIRITPKTGFTQFKTTSVQSAIHIYSSGGAKYTEVTHDDTDGVIATSSGNINLNPASVTRSLKDLEVRSGKKLIIYKSDNSVQGELYYGDGNLFIDTSSGFIRMNIATGLLSLQKSGVDNTIRLYGNGAVKNTSVKHDDTDGVWATSSGDCKFDPAADINANNNTVKNVADISYQAAITQHITLEGLTFTGREYAQEQYRGISGNLLSNTDGAFAQHFFIHDLRVEEAFSMLQLDLTFVRDDAASSIIASLYRKPKSSASPELLAQVTASDSGGSVTTESDPSVSNGVIDTSAYSYYVIVSITNNDAITDARLHSVTIQGTRQKPLT